MKAGSTSVPLICLAELLAAENQLEYRIIEAIDPDPGHIKAIKQSEQRVKNALKKVADHCGGTAGAAAAIAAAEALLEKAQEFYQAWENAGAPIPA